MLAPTIETTHGPLLECVNEKCGLVQRLCETAEINSTPVCKWCRGTLRRYKPKPPIKGGK